MHLLIYLYSLKVRESKDVAVMKINIQHTQEPSPRFLFSPETQHREQSVNQPSSQPALNTGLMNANECSAYWDGIGARAKQKSLAHDAL